MYSVLYVDDEQSLLEVSKIYLENDGEIIVDTTASVTDAIDLIKTARYDAIISDYQMPVMDGIEFLKHVRNEAGDIPFILFTGKGREEVVIQAINNGADFYLQKGGEPRSQFAELTSKIKIAVDKKRAEDQLRQSKEQMADIINFLPDATYAIDLTGKVIAWNLATEEMTGVKASDVMGLGNFAYASRIYGESRPILIDLILSENKEIEKNYPYIIRQENKLISEIYIPTLFNGRGAYVWLIASPLFDGKGNVIGAIESIRDISASKLAEQTLRESEAKYRGVIESIQDVYYRVDMDGNLVLASPSWARLLGYGSLDECIGKNIAKTFYLDPDKRQALLHEIEIKGFIENYEIVLKRKDGTAVVVSTNSHYYSDNSGNTLGIEGIFRDISAQKTAEIALEKSMREFEAIVQGSPIPTFVIDKDHRIISWNKALEEYSGIKAGMVLGKAGAWKGFYKTDRPCLADLIVSGDSDQIKRLYQGKYSPSDLIPGGFEATDFFPGMQNGTWLFFTAAPIRGADGEIMGAVEILQDVTGRKLAEKALNQKNEELYASYEQITAAEEELRQNYEELKQQEENLRVKNEELYASYEQIAANEEELRQNFDDLKRQREISEESEERYRTVFENTGTSMLLIEDDLTVSIANGEFYRMSGYTKQEVEGRKSWKDFIAGDDIETMITQHHLRMMDRTSPLKSHEFRFITRSGEFRTMLPTIDRIPGTGRSVASLLDITQRKEMEEALRENEQRYRNVVEDQTEFICRFLPNGTHIFVNEAYCRYFSKQRGEIIGKKFCPTIPPEERTSVREHFARLTRESPTATIDHRIVMPDGTNRWQRWSDRAIFDENGILTEYQSVGRDITDMKLTEEALQQTNNKLNLLSSITRHDILNKVMACRGYLTLIREKMEGPDLDELFSRVDENIEGVQHQIEYSGKYRDLGIGTPVWQDVGAILGQCRSSDIVLDNQCHNLELFADPMLPNMFTNLMDNTLRHGQGATCVIVRSSPCKSGLNLIWEDNGAGIPDSEKDLIFKRGYGKHSGFGLFFIREMLSITGISIVETGLAGHGARFEITVPRGKFRITG
ncbi:MAG TPA: PAS domain S-box protein [Methanoregulaceae archaeon]|nr:PAS domain S-box protein [Methanoregulaceae archaeon]